MLFAGLLIYLPAAAQPAAPVIKQLPANEYDTLRTILTRANAGMLKDTVLIHYQFHDAFEKMQTDEIIQQQLTAELRRLHYAMAGRKNISIVYLGEPGEATERAKDFNNLITEDKDKQLYRLLFSTGKKAASIMLLPDRQCLMVNDEDKWVALQWSGRDLHNFLKGGQMAVLN